MSEFMDAINAWVKTTKTNLRLTNREVILTMASRIIERSPVGDPDLWVADKPPKGYVPGKFKANWNGGFGQIDFSTTEETDETGEISIVRINASIPEDPTGVFYITNSLPYAIPLEDGWSTQAPFGMVGLTVLEFDEIMSASIVKVKGFNLNSTLNYSSPNIS